MADLALPAINRAHLEALTSDLGIWQHATGPVPNRAFGYCTDDVARALTVDVLHARELGWSAVHASAWRSLRFLRDAFDPVTGRFRNFRDAHGAWIDGAASEDSHGRALRALGATIAAGADREFGANARVLFAAALPAAAHLHALRATASSILGCTAALGSSSLDDDLRAGTGAVLRLTADRLRGRFGGVAGDRDWPWPEPVLTYENALLPHALIEAGRRLSDGAMRRSGLAALDWLSGHQGGDGVFSPIGNDGWELRDGPRARFDQQPIEATTTILAAEAAFAATADTRHIATAERAFAWFLGTNDVGVPVAESGRGACHDGLGPDGVNANQGAESTLMWLTGLEHLRHLRARATASRDSAKVAPHLPPYALEHVAATMRPREG